MTTALPYVAVDRCGDDVTLDHILTASDLFDRATGWHTLADPYTGRPVEPRIL